jgi:RNA polymerase sigma-70 factor (ECF subfamily)
MLEADEPFLTKLAAAGDAAALATLLQTYEAGLLEYAKKRLPQRVWHVAGPEDIVQETCYEACRMISGFVSADNKAFYRWLVRIANLRIKATIQKYRGRRTDSISASISDDASVIGALEQLSLYRRTPSASAAGHEFIFTVERCLEELIPSYRQVISYRFLEGLSVEETAQKMSRDINHVYVLSSRALVAMRERLVSASRFA